MSDPSSRRPQHLTETVGPSSVCDQPGGVIGPYKLREQIGEGGMGIVFVAEQEKPIQRRVAVKIIKPGMDTKEVVARFEAERQALALMSHPNIARVFDAGATDSGRPFFVMELVQGVPITDYCDRSKLTMSQRLELFVIVTRAVQHAHQKGIIHRDLKPTNVLVTEDEGTPVVKVIDFGVAKAINQRLTDRTIYTHFQQMVGTPMYMSPEQADLSGLDVDTRSDIYSLGVLLYELLTGTTPFSRERFQTAAYDEIRRMIREDEPSRPSMKVSTLGDEAANVSEQRGTNPQKLSQLLRGDVDWIVMKSLEKDRNRRYETANSLAEDVERFLRDEEVQARPPSSVYRLRKFVRRHKAGVTSLVIVGAVLLTATAVSAWQARVTLQQRNQARSLLFELRSELGNAVFWAMSSGDEGKVNAAIEKAEKAGVDGTWIRFFRAQLALYYGRPDEAADRLRKIEDDSIAALGMLVVADMYAGDGVGVEESSFKLKERLKAAKGHLTPEERLFAAQGLVLEDARAGRELIQGVLDEINSPLARMIHASVLAEFANVHGDQDAIRQALRDINGAMVFGEDVPSFIHAYAKVIHTALGLGAAPSPSFNELEEWWEKVKHVPTGRFGLLRLMATVSGMETVELVLEEKFSPLITDLEMLYVVPLLLEHKSPKEVLSFIENTPNLGPYGRCWRLRTMAFIEERRTDAIGGCYSMIEEHRSYLIRNHAVGTLFLLGRQDEVRERGDALLASSDHPFWYARESLQYLINPEDSPDFLKDAGPSRLLKDGAHFALALQLLADRDIERARGHLVECVALRMYQSEFYWWARTLLKAIDEQPFWVRRTILSKSETPLNRVLPGP